MLVFISYWAIGKDNDSVVQKTKAVSISEITGVSEIFTLKNPANKFRFCIQLKNEEPLFSRYFDSKTEAEMNQVSVSTIINAIELYFERFKHVPEHHATPVMFQVVDPESKKLVPGKISMFDTPIYTIQL